MGQLAAGLRALEAAGVTTADITFRPPSLDEVFLELTGRPAAPVSPGTPQPVSA